MRWQCRHQTPRLDAPRRSWACSTSPRIPSRTAAVILRYRCGARARAAAWWPRARPSSMSAGNPRVPAPTRCRRRDASSRGCVPVIERIAAALRRRHLGRYQQARGDDGGGRRPAPASSTTCVRCARPARASGRRRRSRRVPDAHAGRAAHHAARSATIRTWSREVVGFLREQRGGLPRRGHRRRRRSRSIRAWASASDSAHNLGAAARTWRSLAALGLAAAGRRVAQEHDRPGTGRAAQRATCLAALALAPHGRRRAARASSATHDVAATRGCHTHGRTQSCRGECD